MKLGFAIGLILGVGSCFFWSFFPRPTESDLYTGTVYPDLIKNQFLNDRGLVNLRFIEVIQAEPDVPPTEALFLLRNDSKESLRSWANSETSNDRYRLFGSALTYVSQVGSFSVRGKATGEIDNAPILFTLEPGEEVYLEVSIDSSWIELHPTDKIQIEIMNIVSEPFSTHQIAPIDHKTNGEQAESLKP